MSSTTVATRLSGELLREVRQFARRGRLGPSEALRQIVDEWVTMARYPALEFRDGPVGRRPGIRGGPDVWEVMMVARDVGDGASALREHFGPHLSEATLVQVQAYAAEHREEVESWVDENDRFGRKLEQEFLARVRE